MHPTLPRPPVSRSSAEVLIREARRRQHRRWIATSLVVVIVGVAGWLVIGNDDRAPQQSTSEQQPTAPGPANASARSIPRSVGTTLLLWRPGRSYVDNLSARHLSSRAPILRDIAYGDYQPLAAVIDNRFVFVGHGLSVSRGLMSAQPRRLSRASGFAPAVHPGGVWVVSARRGRSIARLVSVRGGAARRAVRLPPHTGLVRGTAGGLLLENYAARGAPLELWRPGDAPVLLPRRPSWADGFAATAGLIAYGTGCHGLSPHGASDPDACHRLNVLDVRSGRVASYLSPPSTLGWVPFEFDLVDAFSKPGNRLAAVAAIGPRQAGRGRLYIISLNRNVVHIMRVPGSSGPVRSRVAWAARGNWLFYEGAGHTLQAYQPSSGRIRTSSTPCCQYTVMAAIPSRR